MRVVDPETNQVMVMTNDEARVYMTRLRREGRRTIASHVLAAVLLVGCLAVATYSLMRLARRPAAAVEVRR